MSYLDSSIVNITLPTLARYFHADLSVIEWIVTSYLLMITGLVLIFGRLADMYGRKRLYILGFIVFTLGSALCSAAPTVWLLVAFRCLQGIGAAALLANGAAIITESFPPEERGRTLGTIGSVLAFAAIVGPLLGGLLTDHIGWRSIFYVNIPIGIVASLLSAKVLPSPAAEHRHEQFDFGGAITLVACLTCFLFLVGAVSGSHWRASVFVPLLIGAIVLGLIFHAIEARVSQPLLDLELFRQRAFSFAAAASLLSFWAMSSIGFLVPFYLDRVLGLSPTQTGQVMAPVPLFLVGIAPLGGYLADKFGARAISTIGAVINCIGLAYMSTLKLDTSPLSVILHLVPFGVGMGLFQPPNNSAIMGAVPSTRLGIASGMISVVKNLGSMSGVAVTSLVFTVAQMVALRHLQPVGAASRLVERQAFVSAIHVTFLVSVAVSSVCVITSFVRGDEQVGTTSGPEPSLSETAPKPEPLA
jgi:EmrB/QacA subfamily drug resistance transporter